MGDWEDRGRRWGRTVVTFALVASTAHMTTGADAARRQKERTSMPVEFDKFGPEWVLALLAMSYCVCYRVWNSEMTDYGYAIWFLVGFTMGAVVAYVRRC
jgi:hypothetical protein